MLTHAIGGFIEPRSLGVHSLQLLYHTSHRQGRFVRCMHKLSKVVNNKWKHLIVHNQCVEKWLGIEWGK